MDLKWYVLSTLVRVGFLVYGVWQDATMAVKFTDVDYHVFTDASAFIAKGESPYLRSTYRYTPLLAWALTPNVWLSPVFGKLIFILFDILVGQMIYKILCSLGHPKDVCSKCALIWLLNPLCATVSSRGNAESIIAWLVLMSLSLLLQGRTAGAAIFYALSVHFKIYPITFAIPIYLYLESLVVYKSHSASRTINKTEKDSWRNKTIRVLVSLLPNRKRIVFISVSAAVLGSLTAICYWTYGWKFLFETYLYHIVRGDIRHNFSPYFYLLYLTSNPESGVPLCLRLLVFLPQAMLLLAVSFKFYRQPALCWFLCVFVFVAFNKVCTSQYFLWYLSLVPLVVADLDTSLSSLSGLVILWLIGQALWLFPAYLLEFQGQNTFLLIWAASLLFLCINAFIVHKVIAWHKPRKLKS